LTGKLNQAAGIEKPAQFLLGVEHAVPVNREHPTPHCCIEMLLHHSIGYPSKGQA
jgi:hypothetical protein